MNGFLGSLGISEEALIKYIIYFQPNLKQINCSHSYTSSIENSTLRYRMNKFFKMLHISFI